MKGDSSFLLRLLYWIYRFIPTIANIEAINTDIFQLTVSVFCVLKHFERPNVLPEGLTAIAFKFECRIVGQQSLAQSACAVSC